MKNYKFSNNKLLSSFLVTISYFIFQGMRYMYWKEFLLRIIMQIIIIFILLIKLNLILSLILSHIILLFVYGQIFVVLRYTPSFKKVNYDYLTSILKLIRKIYPDECVIYVYGSYCRNEVKSTSDLDLRVQVNGNWIQWLKIFYLTVKIKILSNIRGFPVDIYLFENTDFLKKLRDDEIPIIL
tara:strand:- start:1435 stop:1983 length:549 start_codon:yes stop_codon:yes gene_type:complete